ncbi:MAG: hypothetical protein M0036_07025 [Desulfobacteraceae bacterium]|nr:hypothetical protein [Desulfobacteraceae bacterium]
MKQPKILWESCIAGLEAFLVRSASAKPPVRVVLTTYDFDADAFQRTWMRLLRHFRAQVVVLADADALHRTTLTPGSLEGFQLVPVSVMGGGVFHPKVALVRKSKEVFAALGSGNLTQGGMGGNLELQLTGSTYNPSEKDFVSGVVGFLKQLVAPEANVRMPPTAIHFCKQIITDLCAESEIVMSSLQKPLWGQIVERTKMQQVDNVTLLSPWHAGTGQGSGTEPEILSCIRKDFGNSIRVLTDGDGHNAPKLPVQSVLIYKGRNAFHDQEDEPVLPPGLHAKSIIVHGNKKGWWFIGSANVTKPALMNAVGDKGNVEVIAGLPLDERLIKCLDNTWSELFDEEKKQVDFKPSPFSRGVAAVVLGGEIIHRRKGSILRLMAKKDQVVKAVLMQRENDPNSKRVTVNFRKGIGEVGGNDFNLLIPSMPDRKEGATSVIIYEYHPKNPIPVVVTVPVLLSGEGDIDPKVILLDLLIALRGRWPVARPKIMSQSEDTENDIENIDEKKKDDIDHDLDSLTHSDHLGELDRLGRLVAMLIKVTPKDEMEWLLKIVNELSIQKHYKEAILAAIDKVNL